MENSSKKIVITGGAGYLGSAMIGNLLEKGYFVSVLDNFLYGGSSIIAYLDHPRFHWKRVDILGISDIETEFENTFATIHLAAIAGFPACQSIGREMAWRHNVDATLKIFEISKKKGASYFIFPSTYTAFGSEEQSILVNEKAPGNPKTVYAETKIEAEKQLLANQTDECSLIILRFADIYGLSPRTRFDALINQFVWQALNKREIVIFQKGYYRSFIHLRDAIRAVMYMLKAPREKIHNEIFNVGSDQGNFSKEQIAEVVGELIPGTRILRKDVTYGGYRHDIRADFSKIASVLDFKTTMDLKQGITEIKEGILSGLIRDPGSDCYFNARFPIAY
jgi:nucleoside-diphosphate-sugar epimerase